MKKIVTVSFAVVILFACNSSNSGDKLVGTYVKVAIDDVNRLWDTLYIAKVPGDAEKMFSIERKSKFQRINPEAGEVPVRYRTKHFTGIYEQGEGTLSLEPGLTYSVDLSKGILTNGKSTYTRIP